MTITVESLALELEQVKTRLAKLEAQRRAPAHANDATPWQRQIIAAVVTVSGVSPKELFGPRRGTRQIADARAVLCMILRRPRTILGAGMTLATVARFIGRTTPTVRAAVARFEAESGNDHLYDMIEKVDARLLRADEKLEADQTDELIEEGWEEPIREPPKPKNLPPVPDSPDLPDVYPPPPPDPDDEDPDGEDDWLIPPDPDLSSTSDTPIT